jgi:4-amino-4-deoxychorismate lyase
VTPGRSFIDGNAASALPADDRGLLYGDGVFETLALRNGKLRFLDAHLARLAAGLERLGIAADPATVAEQVARAHASLLTGIVRVVVTRGSGPRGYAPPISAVPRIIVTCFPAPEPARPATALTIRMCSTRVATSPSLAGLKTLNRLEHVLARREWTDPAIGEGLMCDADGSIVCGTASNLFVVCGGQLMTPDLSSAGVRGIMRGVVIDAARELGRPVAETRIEPGVLGQAEEVFMTNALTGIRPVVGLPGRHLPVGAVTRELCGALSALGVGECAAFC